MRPEMRAAATTLKGLLDGHPATAGLSIRVRGDHLILGRMEPTGSQEQTDPDDHVRLTRLGGSTYGLSVRRHTGRWERTPFVGTLEEMAHVISGCMQHLVAPY